MHPGTGHRPSSYSLRHSVLQGLAGPERRSLGSGDLDLFLGLRIAPDALTALSDLENAEAHELDLIALRKRFGDGVERGVDYLLRILLG